MGVSRPEKASVRKGATAALPHEAPAGLRILVPGYAQWTWRQRERGLVFFGSFATALAMGAFSWGTWTGLLILAFAFGTHVAASVDVIRQSAFPGFGRWMPWVSVSGGLGLGVYGPVFAVALWVACPGMGRGPSDDGYLVNCLAYTNASPHRGDQVWLQPLSPGEPRVGRVLAEPGEEVEWFGSHLRIGGTVVPVGSPFRSARPPFEIAYTVPDRHLLVAPEPADGVLPRLDALVIVPESQVVGRAWARLYPVGRRQLLD